MNIYLNIFLSGVLILIVAMLANILATAVGLLTWYDFLKDIQGSGFLETIKNTGYLSLIFLFLIYPFILGITAYYAFNCLIK